jgi:hypothetical protein
MQKRGYSGSPLGEVHPQSWKEIPQYLLNGGREKLTKISYVAEQRAVLEYPFRLSL